MSCAGRHDTLLLGCLRPPADICIGMKLRPSTSELCRWLGVTYGQLATRYGLLASAPALQLNYH